MFSKPNTCGLLEREVMFIYEVICMVQAIPGEFHMPPAHGVMRTAKPRVYSMWERK